MILNWKLNKKDQVPEDGPGGALMAYTGRDPWRPAHIHFIIEAPGYQKVTIK